jgi:hypothetical protein
MSAVLTHSLNTQWHGSHEIGFTSGEVFTTVCSFSNGIAVGSRLGVVTIGNEPPVQLGNGPVRHLVHFQGNLWAACAGQLHHFSNGKWSSTPGEPTGLEVDSKGRLWSILGGRVRLEGKPVSLPLSRPWCLLATPTTLWIGASDGVLQVHY